jgi:hypothetical protein
MNPITQPVTESPVHADQRLEIRSGDVAAKEIDGEILVMNVSNGMYYSLQGVGAVTWRLLADGYSLRQAAGALADGWHEDGSRTLSDVMALAIRLVDEGLVSVASAPVSQDEASVSADSTSISYAPPELNSYSDMADLLALDPPMPSLAETSFIPPEEA